MNKIYIKGLENPKDIHTILSELFKRNLGDCMRDVETFSNKECTIIQCSTGRRRSFDDIMDIVHTYLPEARIEEVLHEVLILGVKAAHLGEHKFPYMFICTDINKPVLLYVSYLCPNTDMNNDRAHMSKYTWTSLLKIFNIENNLSLEKYISNYEKDNKRD